MSRSGYCDDCDDCDEWALNLYRGNVNRALKGKRGQTFLKDMLIALDAMPHQRLIAERLEIGGQVCALGAIAVARGISMYGIHPDNAKRLSKLFNIAKPMVLEIMFENDEAHIYGRADETPEGRWFRMRQWVASQIKDI